MTGLVVDDTAAFAALRRSGPLVPMVFPDEPPGTVCRRPGMPEGRADGPRSSAITRLALKLAVQRPRRGETSSARESGVTVDLSTRTVRVGGAQARLTERECALLVLLMTSPGRPLARGDLFDALWAGRGRSSLNVVDVYIGYLRRKLAEIAPEAAQVIVTVRGRGFMYQPMAEVAADRSAGTIWQRAGGSAPRSISSRRP